MGSMPDCICIKNTAANIECEGIGNPSSQNLNPRCQKAWTEVLTTFPEIGKKSDSYKRWETVEKFRHTQQRKRYLQRILLKEELWDGVNKTEAELRTEMEKRMVYKSKDCLVRVWREKRLQESLDNRREQRGALEKSFSVRKGQESEDVDPSILNRNSLPVKGELLKMLWWSSPAADDIKALWTNGMHEVAITRLGLNADNMGNGVILTFFECSNVKTWRKPTCLDGVLCENFKVSQDKAEPFGLTVPYSSSSGKKNRRMGFPEIVHTVSDGWNLKLRREYWCNLQGKAGAQLNSGEKNSIDE